MAASFTAFTSSTGQRTWSGSRSTLAEVFPRLGSFAGEDFTCAACGTVGTTVSESGFNSRALAMCAYLPAFLHVVMQA